MDGAYRSPHSCNLGLQDATSERNICRKKSCGTHRTLSIFLFPVLNRRTGTWTKRERPSRRKSTSPSFLGEITLAVLYLRARVDYVRVPLLPPRGKKSRKFRSTCHGNRCHLFVCSAFEMQSVDSSATTAPGMQPIRIGVFQVANVLKCQLHWYCTHVKRFVNLQMYRDIVIKVKFQDERLYPKNI